MSYHHGGWAPYISVAERRKQAEREIKKLQKKGHPISPVRLAGRAIATTFWGKAWCNNLESYRDFENRIPRGRSYVRNGLVVDLQIAPREVKAMVSGSSIYTVTITIAGVPKVQWQSICRDCGGGIDSVVELLQGRLSKGVMERICRQNEGLFPRPSEIKFRCNCPDSASMCKHIAAVLYGVGSRLDEKPELLFRLRAADENDLVANLDNALPLSTKGPTAAKLLENEDISALFGLDIAGVTAPVDVGGYPQPASNTGVKAGQSLIGRKAIALKIYGARPNPPDKKEVSKPVVTKMVAKRKGVKSTSKVAAKKKTKVKTGDRVASRKS